MPHTPTERSALSLLPTKRTLAIFLALAIAFAFLAFPSHAPQMTQESLRLCLTTLIPALFPMLVLTDFLARMGIGAAKNRGRLARLLGVGSAGCAIWLISLLAGFPHAARLSADGVERGQMTPDEADRVCAFSSIPSPAFLIGGIGQGMLSSPLFGAMLYGIALLASLLTALTLRLLFRPTLLPSLSGKQNDRPTPPIFASLAASIASASDAMLNICATVLFFSLLRSLLSLWITHPTALLLLSGFLEITSCAAACVRSLPRDLLLPVLALLCAWSGCSVHAQVALLSGGSFPLRHYFTGKAIFCLWTFLLSVGMQNFL